MSDNLQEQLKAVSEKLKADVILYHGDIDRAGAEAITDITPENKNVVLILCTPGGDAHAAYKIARQLQEKYARFYLYVYGYCKSAGTLIAIGSDELIMGHYAEFGPLDVQLQEKDEIWRYSSGLNVSESLDTLKAETLRFFRHTLVDLVKGAGISTKTAAELATNLSIGFITPIISQIDPVRVGEIQRAVKIALAYGERLIAEKRGNLRSGAELAQLVQAYPDHGFVIDYQEAKGIFKVVRRHDNAEKALGKSLEGLVKYPTKEISQYIKKIYPENTHTTGGQNEQSSSKPASAGSAGKNKKGAGKSKPENSGGEVRTIKAAHPTQKQLS